MKIAHLTSVHSMFDTRIFHKQCRSLADMGHEVHLVVPREGEERTEVHCGVVIHTVTPPVGRLKRFLHTTPHILEVARGLEADIYHFHDPEFLRLALDSQQSVGKPVVYDAHEDLRLHVLYKDYFFRTLRRPISWLTGCYEDRVVKGLAGVVAATPKIAERFRDHANCITVFNYPLPDELVPCVSTLTPRRSGKFAYVGSLSEKRGIESMIAALPYVGPDASLTLAGKWSDPAFRQRCSAMPGWKQVEDAGFLDRSGVRQLLSTSQVGLVVLHPTRTYLNDSYPVKLFEYMSAGLPVVASDFPLWRRIITETGCGLLINPLDARDIAGALQKLMASPEEAREMGRCGQRAVREKYNWSSEAAKLEGFYKRLANKLV